MGARIKEASIHYEETDHDGIHTEIFPAQSFTYIEGAIEIATEAGYVIVPLAENVRKVKFKK